MSWFVWYYLILHGAGVCRYWRQPLKLVFLCLMEAPVLWGMILR